MNVATASVPSAVAALGLVGGFAVARRTGRRDLGGGLFAVAGAWCVREWYRARGPAAAAIIVSLLRRRSLTEIGWKVGRMKWLVAGWVIPISVSFAAYGLIWIVGLGTVPNPIFLQRARLTLGMTSQSNGLVIVAAFMYISILGLLPGMIAAIGEEIGWRGFLVPELAKWMSFPKTALVSGAIWCIWHMPAILSGSYGITDTPRWYQIGCFSAMVVSSAVVLAWMPPMLTQHSQWASA